MVEPLTLRSDPRSTRPGSPAAWTSTAWMICLFFTLPRFRGWSADDRDAGVSQQAAQLVDELLGQRQDRRAGRTGVDSDQRRSCLDGASIVVRLEEDTDRIDLRPQRAPAVEVAFDGHGLE